MSNFLIRGFQSNDQSAARGLILEGLRDHFGSINERLNPDLRDIESSYLALGHDFYLAIENERLVGTAALIQESPHQSRVVRLSVARDRRRAGVARRLMDHLVARAREVGSEELLAFTEPDWEDAVGFYLNYGFSQFGSDEVDIHLKLKIERSNTQEGV